LEMPPGKVEAAHIEQFTEDPPVQRNPGRALSVKVMVNFAPQNANSVVMRPSDTLALVTMLRRIAREPQFGKFSVVAFNIASQKVVYRQSATDRIDFPALGKAIQTVEPGLVNMKLLENKRGEVEFLTDFVKKEMSGPDRPDALIFAGPKFTVVTGTPDDELKPIADSVKYPLFYLNYNVDPKGNPWRDSIGRVVRLFDGKEYTISRPRDLWFSISEIVMRVVESSQGNQ
ncbi:MAG: acetyltransferase, partial [Acidobacteriota bacterium]